MAAIVVAVVSAGALVGLGWLLVQQDAAIERQRQADLRQQRADRVASEMRAALADVSGPAAAETDGLLRAEFFGGRLVLPPGGRVLYQPLPPTTDVVPRELAVAETLEFRGDLASALAAYEGLARGATRVVAAVALARVGRVERKLGRADRALAAYDALSRFGDASVEGLPATLVARIGRATTLETTGAGADLRREAINLRDELLAGRWALTLAQFEFYAAEAARWLGDPVRPADADLARAEALAWAWDELRTTRESGTRALRLASGPVIVRWVPLAEGLRVTLADARHLSHLCAAASKHERCAIHDGNGALLTGASDGEGASARLLTDASGGVWTVRVAPLTSDAPRGSPRRALLLSTVALAGLVLTTGWFFLLRGMARERAAGRAQADFVAAVSHEFRSPLTSMSHIAELLASGRLSGDATTRAYDVLVHDTARLRTLVEQVLEFGRFEAGGPVLQVERIDVAILVGSIVDEFRIRAARDGYDVVYDAADAPLWLDADREALALAVWNLLDNAVKYSPEVKTIWVQAQCLEGCVMVSVRDEGLGIPLREQAAIFQQFVRGAEPKARRIRGTGLGLALVRHVARAHGGDVLVTSEPGRGSTFTIRFALRRPSAA